MIIAKVDEKHKFFQKLSEKLMLNNNITKTSLKRFVLSSVLY